MVIVCEAGHGVLGHVHLISSVPVRISTEGPKHGAHSSTGQEGDNSVGEMTREMPERRRRRPAAYVTGSSGRRARAAERAGFSAELGGQQQAEASGWEGLLMPAGAGGVGSSDRGAGARADRASSAYRYAYSVQVRTPLRRVAPRRHLANGIGGESVRPGCADLAARLLDRESERPAGCDWLARGPNLRLRLRSSGCDATPDARDGSSAFFHVTRKGSEEPKEEDQKKNTRVSPSQGD